MINRFVMIDFVPADISWFLTNSNSELTALKLWQKRMSHHQRVTVHFISTHFFKAFVNIWAAPSITIVVGASDTLKNYSSPISHPLMLHTTSTHSKILFPQLPSVDELVPYCEYQYQSLQRYFIWKWIVATYACSRIDFLFDGKIFFRFVLAVMQCQDDFCHARHNIVMELSRDLKLS